MGVGQLGINDSGSYGRKGPAKGVPSTSSKTAKVRRLLIG